MRIDKTLHRLGGIAVAAALVTAAAPAAAAYADPAPSPSPSAPSGPSATSTPVPSASTATASPTAALPPATSATSATPSAGASPTVIPSRRAVAVPTGSATRAAAWLVTQLTDGSHLPDSEYGGMAYPNYGGTADVAIALASTGTQDPTLRTVVRYLQANVSGYADLTGAQGGPFIGALGKLAVVAESTGQDPHDFGGYDLLALITFHVCTAASTTQYGPCSAAGDFDNADSTTSQALDVLALERGGVAVPPSALARLVSLQCPDGGFSSTLLVAGDTCTPDVDSTGYAEQALVLDPGADAQVQSASQYLLGAQQTDGGWINGTPPTVNANSTALAVQALIAGPAAAPRAAGAPHVVSASAVTAGQELLVSLQHGNGALQLNPSTSPAADNVLATEQSVPAIAGATLTTLRHPISLAVVVASPTPSVTSSTVAPTTAPTASGTAPTSTAPAGDTLPFTGTEATRWSQLAALLLVVGAGLLLAGTALRRRRGAHR